MAQLAYEIWQKGHTEETGTEKQLDQPIYEHIDRNEFSYRKHVKQNEEDIAICICQYDASNPDTACGDRCLNVLTSTECTPGYCPCDNYCMNQKFQKCEYAKLRLFKTDGRGWGVLADENIKAGQFIIEYCGEVISSNEAKQRAEAYEAEGVKDAYIISLNAQESIDATKKGSLARFINHSCQPNCETRKRTVLGEIRVGIFAKQDIQLGAELSYDYKFEWFGGAKVRCLCGAACCSEYLGAKSRGFMAANDDCGDNSDSISVEDISIYYSDDDEPTSRLLPEDDAAKKGEQNNKSENKNKQTSSPGQINSMSKSLMPYTVTNGKRKSHARKRLSAKEISERLWLKEACDKLLANEALMNEAKLKQELINQEIKPFVEKHDRDAQNKVPTSVAESWLDAHCNRMATEFDFFSSVIENVICNPKKPKDDAMSNDEAGDGVNPLENND